MATLTTPQTAITSQDIQLYRDRVNNLLGTATQPTPTTPVTPVAPSAPVAPVLPATPTPAQPVATTGGYTVQAGDSLSKIAQRNGMTLQQILDLNPTYKANPNLVRIGANLNLSQTPNPATTVVSPVQTTVPSQTPEQKAQEDAKVLGQQAGSAGYSPEQYNQLLQQKNMVTKEESDAIAKELGIPVVEGELFKKPSQTSEQLYQSAYATSGLADIKKKVDEINAEIATERAQLAEAIGKIDENPFLIESSRVGRGKRILDQAENRIKNKLDQAKQYQDLYDSGVKEINNIVTRNQSDFSTEQTINTAKLNYLQKKAEQQLSTLKAQKVSEATDLPSYLSGAGASSKAQKVIGTSDTGYFTYDPSTKKFIQVAGGATTPTPKGTFTSGGLTYTPQDQAEDSQALEASRGADGFVDPALYQRLAQAWVNNKGLIKDFLAKYPPKNYVNPANTWLPSYLMPSGTATKKTTTTGTATINDL